MIIATRHLVLREKNRNVEIPVRIHAPEKAEVDWICRFEIGWPEGEGKRWAGGVDAVQALELALKMIGAQIYTSDHHASGNLFWEEQGRGYGFPVTNNIRDLLVGDDKKFF